MKKLRSLILAMLLPWCAACSCGNGGDDVDAEEDVTAADDEEVEVDARQDAAEEPREDTPGDALDTPGDPAPDDGAEDAAEEDTAQEEAADAAADAAADEVPPCTIAHPFDLSSLDGTNGFVFTGSGMYNHAGFSVSGAGDIDGDGYDDVLIGAPGAMPPGDSGSGAGQTYVIFGGPSMGGAGRMDRAMLDGATGFVINGILWGDGSGYSVSDAGDVNGDGYDDIIIGAPDAGFAIDRNDGGQAYVVYGGAGIGSSGAIELDSLDGIIGARCDGAIYHQAGYSVSGAGDVNADGYADLIIGAQDGGSSYYGASYLIWGGPSIGTDGILDLPALDGVDGVALEGEGDDDSLGYAVSGAGDVDGDGYDDFIAAAPFADDPTGLQRGIVYLIYGAPTLGTGGVLHLSSLTSTLGLKIHDSGGHIGLSVSGAGDINDDGYTDFIIGGPSATPESEYWAGVVYLVWGGPDMDTGGWLDLAPLDPAECWRIAGGLSRDQLGFSVSDAGDVNRDTIPDIILGANWADPGGRAEAGAAYLAYAGAGMVHSIAALDGTTGVRFEGIVEGDETGHSASGAGDLNGDGWPDLVIGASKADPGGQREAGEAYVIFGGSLCP